MSGLISLFPTPVLHKKQLIGGDRMSEIRTRIAEQQTHTNHADDGLSHTISAAVSILLDDKTVSKIKEAISELGCHLFGQALDWTIKEAWANVLEPGGEQTMHLHANSFVSGVLYLTRSHASANLVFHRPSGGLDFVFSNHNRETGLNIFNAPRQQIGPIEAGDVVLFPSYLLHSVPTNEGKRRLSLAFNAIPHALETWGYRVLFDHDVVSED